MRRAASGEELAGPITRRTSPGRRGDRAGDELRGPGSPAIVEIEQERER
jgi:hypothetical protein